MRKRERKLGGRTWKIREVTYSRVQEKATKQ